MSGRNGQFKPIVKRKPRLHPIGSPENNSDVFKNIFCFLYLESQMSNFQVFSTSVRALAVWWLIMFLHSQYSPNIYIAGAGEICTLPKYSLFEPRERIDILEEEGSVACGSLDVKMRLSSPKRKYPLFQTNYKYFAAK